MKLIKIFKTKPFAKPAEKYTDFKKVVLAGNPNAGKTTLFNALTGSSLRTGNFHGVTTSPAKKTVKNLTFIDVPGAYAFTPYSMEEQSAIDEVKSADLVINVVDALTLKNSLNLTRGILSTGASTVVYITKYQSLRRRGGKIDFSALSKILGVPVLNCSPRELKRKISNGEIFAAANGNKPNANFSYKSVETAFSEGSTALTKADKLFYNRFFALAFFIFAITAMFFFAFHPAMFGAKLKGLTEELICVKLSNAITANMSNPALISLISEGILGGAGSVASFIPQLCVLYLALILLDESGITSALAFATDGLFEKVRLSGRAAFSLVSGFGCTAAAILTTRGYSTASAQKRTIAILPFVPCGAKLPVFLTFLSPLFANPFPVITCFYFAGLAASLIASLLIKGGGEGMLSEVTPIVLPRLKAVAIKLYFQIKSFIIKVAGIVTLFCIASWFFSHYSFALQYVQADKSMLAAFSKSVTFLFYPMGVNDWRLCYAALCGFIAKENVAATVALLMPAGTGLAISSALAMCTFILFCPACVSALSASCKETSVRFTLKCALFQLLLAFTAAYSVKLIFGLFNL